MWNDEMAWVVAKFQCEITHTPVYACTCTLYIYWRAHAYMYLYTYIDMSICGCGDGCMEYDCTLNLGVLFLWPF